MYSKKSEQEFYASYVGNEKHDPDILSRYIESFVTNPFSVFENASVLEIGAGPAQYSRLFKDQYNSKVTVASDLVWQQLARSKGENSHSGVSACAGDCFDLPFKSGSFDIVFGSMLLHRFRDMSDVLNEVKRVLKCGGQYLGVEPSPRNPSHLVRHLLAKHSENEFWVTRNIIQLSFEKAGFVVDVQGMAPRHPFVKKLGGETCLGICSRRSQ